MSWTISSFNQSQVDDHLEGENGSISTQDPMERAASVYVFIFNIVNCLMALPLNLYIALIILSTNRLRNQPKYVMKVITASSSLLTLLKDGQEAIYYIEPSEMLCQSSIFTLAWPPVFLMFNTFLTLVDRTVAINKPQFYKENVTPIVVIVSSLLLNFTLVFLLDFVYIFGVEPLRCAYQTPHLLTLIITWFTLFSSCVALASLIYDKTRPADGDLGNEENEREFDRQLVISLIPIVGGF